MNKKLTAWFPSNTKPARIGAYHCQGGWSGAGYQYWNGKFWGGWACCPETAFENRDFKSERQNPEWRGLSSSPKDTK